MDEIQGVRIHISGTVQGVGFRPFVYGMAMQLGLKGWVRNTSAGVDIELEAPASQIEAFLHALRSDLPPLARIDDLSVDSMPPNGFTHFEIIHSEAIDNAFQPVSPDVCICPDCLRELFDAQDRRYRYPFINCTNCGPRFTIINDIPYDRPNTTMAGFPLCPECAAEYNDPLNRRFHAQPVACPVCGPQVWLETCSDHTRSMSGETALQAAQHRLADGEIVAIKGLGGFHLACDATNQSAVARLRKKKLRVDKPFALMMPDLQTIEAHCVVSSQERQLLETRQRPILILRRRPDSTIAGEVAPEQTTLGVMLPYTPLHYLLFAAPASGNANPLCKALVMTSGNISEEPIATDNDEARRRLGGLADAYLMHDRPIRTRCDDSVLRIPDERTAPLFLRRARGYAPEPIQIPWELPPLLAAGTELKNTFCLTRGRYAFLSQHIGDMENFETLQSFEDGIQHYEKLFRIQPEALAYDLHPDYLATRYALQRAAESGLPAAGVQHHHAHIAACLAEHGDRGDQPVIGVAFDGTGYGDDGAIWGGEFLLADYLGYQRAAHLAYTPLPGGEAAIRKPARTALAHLWQAGMEWEPDLAPVDALGIEERSVLRTQLEKRINSPLTSSAGRLFDAVAALAGIRQQVNYEAQAAIEFETLADPDEQAAYPFDYHDGEAAADASSMNALTIQPTPMLQAVLQDIRNRVPAPRISARFHNGVALMVLEVCRAVRQRSGVNQVVLSGGVWQNVTLLIKTAQHLKNAGFELLTHKQLPPNDGGVALGQAVIAWRRIYNNNA